MTRADVVVEIGGDCKARPVLGQPVQHFESGERGDWLSSR
jgi:hypothetical protein